LTSKKKGEKSSSSAERTKLGIRATGLYLLGVGYVYILLVAELGHYCGGDIFPKFRQYMLRISKASLDVKQRKYYYP
jgi:hypothetical protein